MRALGHGGAQFGEQFGDIDGTVEFGAHVEALGSAVDELLIADDIHAATKQDPGDSVDQSRTIRALD